MNLFKERTSLPLFLIGIVLCIALVDHQSWQLAQLVHINALPLNVVFALEGLVTASLAIFFYARIRNIFQQLDVRDKDLSQREREVLECILDGKSNRLIQESLYIEKSTLKSHINRIYKKLEVHNREDLINRYSRE